MTDPHRGMLLLVSRRGQGAAQGFEANPVESKGCYALQLSGRSGSASHNRCVLLQVFHLKLFWVGIFKFYLVKFCWIWSVAEVDTGTDSGGLSQERL